MKTILPCFINEFGKNSLSESDFEAPEFCKKKLDRDDGKCRQHYQENCQSGARVCPYGLSTFTVKDSDNEFYHFFGLELKAYKSETKRKRTCSSSKGIIKCEPIITADIRWIHERTDSSADFALELQRLQHFRTSWHEIRNLNSNVKSIVETLLADESNEKKSERLSSIFAASQTMTGVFNYLDHLSNKELSKKISMNVHGKFQKSIKINSFRARARKVEIQTIGTLFQEAMLYDFFEILPYIAIENAVKYAKQNSTITVRFSDEVGFGKVEIQNLGPLLQEHEVSKVFDQDFRSEKARSLSIPGSGRGLATIKSVCEINEVTVEILHLPQDENWGQFSLIVKIPK